MKKIGFKDFLNILLNNIMKPNINLPTFYLQDGDSNYHKVNEVDLYTDRICCEDGYWDCYEWLLQSEYEEDGRVFIKE